MIEESIVVVLHLQRQDFVLYELVEFIEIFLQTFGQVEIHVNPFLGWPCEAYETASAADRPE